MGESVLYYVFVALVLRLCIAGAQSRGIEMTRLEGDDKCELGTLYLHPYDCRQFYKCVKVMGKAEIVIRTCFDGEVFNPTLNLCYPEDPKVPCSPDPDPNVYLSVISGLTDDSCNPEEETAVCIDCSKYKICDPASSIWKDGGSCGNKLCDNVTSPLHATCKDDVPSCVPFQCGEDGIFPDPYDCKRYHVCDAGPNDHNKTCNNQKAFNPATKMCDAELPKEDKCTTPLVKCDGTTAANVKKEYPDDCMLFYTCEKSVHYNEALTPVIRSCKSGEYFKVDSTTGGTGKCVSATGKNEVDPTDVPCHISMAVSGFRCFKHSDWNTYPPGKNVCPTVGYMCSDVNVVESNTTCPDGQAFNQDTKLCDTLKKVCPELCSAADYLKGRNPDDCSKYFECKYKGGPAEVKTCPQGQVFDDAYGICDDPSNVPMCSSNPNNPTSTESSTPSTGPLTTPTVTDPTGGTTAETTTPQPIISTTPFIIPTTPYVCTKPGYFPNPSYATCTNKFIACIPVSGHYVPQYKTCTPGYIFCGGPACCKGQCP